MQRTGGTAPPVTAMEYLAALVELIVAADPKGQCPE
jgi:hypothetical protein